MSVYHLPIDPNQAPQAVSGRIMSEENQHQRIVRLRREALQAIGEASDCIQRNPLTDDQMLTAESLALIAIAKLLYIISSQERVSV